MAKSSAVRKSSGGKSAGKAPGESSGKSAGGKQPAGSSRGGSVPAVQLTPDAPQSAQSMLHLQRFAGNRAVRDRKNVTTVQRTTPADPCLTHSGGTASTQPVLQRQPATGRSFVLDGQSVATGTDLANWYNERLIRLVVEANRLTAEQIAAPSSVAQLAARTNVEVATLRGRGANEIGVDEIGRAADWLNSLEGAFSDIDRRRARAAAADLNTAAEVIAKSASGMSKVSAKLQDQLRHAMLADDGSSILAITDFMTTVLDTSLVLKDLALDLNKTSVKIIAEEIKWLGKGTPPSASWLPKVLDIATQVDKAYAAFALARSAYAVATGGATPGEEGRAAVGAMATAISAMATLRNASAWFTVYANVHIGPLTNLCLAMLANLDKMVADQNLMYMQEGLWDAVAWRVEPGGRAMFDFMRLVMRAGGPGEIPTPPSAIADLMVRRQEALESGTREEVPTEGLWFWEKLDQDKVKGWLLRHRREVWTMFYGSAPVPD